LCCKIIDTPQYQRLRDISQLGGVYYVFTGAASNRFEHCIGVSHLARTFIEKIKQEQPELGITASDVLCVEIAGLCHDLGHGPFSHLYDGAFLSASNKWPHFVHEHASIAIFDLLIEENNLLPEFAANHLTLDGTDFTFPICILRYSQWF
jgi:deoxynucleoside triphosphate triphosphohydrolase SAMHD1